MGHIEPHPIKQLMGGYYPDLFSERRKIFRAGDESRQTGFTGLIH
jgi:hypothetical protein